MKEWLTQALSRKKRTSTFIAALLLALLLHIGFMTLLVRFMSEEKKPEQPLKVRPISLADLNKKAKKTPKYEKKQVVDTAKPEHEIRPEKADLLAEHNNSTPKQSINKDNSLTPKKVSAQTNNKQQRTEAPASAQKNNASQKSGVGEKKEGLKVPSWKELASADGQSFADLVDAPSGKETSLNTWEWKHATFFNRIKQRVAANWSPNSRIKKYDPQGKQLGQQDRMTSVSVTINERGDLLEIQVASSSGVTYLDDEAVKAFRDAAPFLHPPRQLFEKTSNFTFEFGFHLSFGRGFGFGFL